MMIPSGGISLLTHTLINIFYSFIKYPRKAAPFLIILAVAVIIITSGSMSVVNSLEDKNNFQLIQEVVSPCAPVKQEYSENKVILRVDDIQANAYEPMAKSIIKDAKKYNMRLVLGTVPKDFPADKKMARIVRMNNCNLEIAMHGWGHFSDEEENLFEFENMEEMEAKTKIGQGKKILEEVSGKSVVTFIPPGNEISDETKKVLNEDGIKYISANEETGEFGMTISTFDFPKNVLVKNDEILKKCAEMFEKKDLCIIVIHPQDYMTDGKPDAKKYKLYLNLLDELRKMNVYSVTFSDLDQLKGQLKKEQPITPANFFQTPSHPFRLNSIERTCPGQFFSRIQSCL